MWLDINGVLVLLRNWGGCLTACGLTVLNSLFLDFLAILEVLKG